MYPNCSSGNNLRVLAMFALILWGTNNLFAEVFITGAGRGVDPALQVAADNKLVPDMLNASANSAALNAVNAMPLGFDVPEKFAAGFQLNAGAGPSVDGETIIFDLPRNPNASFNNVPILFPARGGASASRFYALTSGSLINLRKDYIIGVHAAFHNLKLDDSGSVNVLEDPAGDFKKAKLRIRSREIGARLSIPWVDPLGTEAGRWNGVRFITGVTYAWHRTNARGSNESDSYLQVDPSLDLTAGSNALSIFRKLETRTSIENDSRNFVVPFELMTGVRLGFLEINMGPGLALNFGRHDVTTRIDAVVCNFAPEDCSTREASFALWNAVLDPSLNPLNSANILNPLVVSLLDQESAPFQIYGKRRIHSRALIAYWNMEIRLQFSYANLILRTATRGADTSGSLAFEVRI